MSDYKTLELPLSSEVLTKVVESAEEYAYSNGLVMGSSKNEGCVLYSPFCLIPSSFPAKWFNYAKDIQCLLNQLIDRVAHDNTFLKLALERTIKSDDFTNRLYQIHQTVQAEGLAQPLSLGLFRSDYMLDCDSTGTITGIKQVEINTIASSFGGLITKLHGLHSYVLRLLEVDSSNVPIPLVAPKLAHGLFLAWKAYDIKEAIILILVEEKLINFSDQRTLEYAVQAWDSHLKIERCTLQELHAKGSLDGLKLFLNGKEVAVIYFRTGYVPQLCHSEEDWETRLMIERSAAIKCPSINYHLAGSKKIQQELSKPGVLEQFIKNSEDVKKLRAVFAGQYGLEMVL